MLKRFLNWIHGEELWPIIILLSIIVHVGVWRMGAKLIEQKQAARCCCPQSIEAPTQVVSIAPTATVIQAATATPTQKPMCSLPRVCSMFPEGTPVYGPCEFGSCSPFTNENPTNPTGVPGLSPVSVCGTLHPRHTATLADGTEVVIDAVITEYFYGMTGTPRPEPHVVVYVCTEHNGECWAFDGRDVIENLDCGTPAPAAPCPPGRSGGECLDGEGK